LLKPFKNRKGYLMVNIKDLQKTKSVHRLVADAFIPNVDNKPQINHINGIKSDNKVSNLEWVTNEENFNHALANGLRENCGRALRKKVIQYDLNR
jgi:hypothetical protein